MSQSGCGRVHAAVWPRHRPLQLLLLSVVLSAVLATLAPPLAAHAATYTFTPVADAYTRSDAAATNFGASRAVSARAAASQTRHAYLRFNVVVPAGATIQRATLNVYSATGGANVDLRDVASDNWTETSLTWNREPVFSPVPAAHVATLGKARTTSFNATGVVTGAGPASMAMTTTSATTTGINSREASKSTRPKLVVVTAPSSLDPGLPVPAPAPAPAPVPDPSPATDTTPPDTTITSAPPSPTTATSASFSFAGTDDVTAAGALSFQCAYDGGAYQGCSSIKTYSPVAAGPHAVAIRAIDAAGNVDPSPALAAWQVDAPAPPPADSTPPITLGGPWAWDARSAPLDPGNATLAPRVIANVSRPNMALSDWAVATADAQSGDPEYAIPRTSQGGSITVRIPLGTRPDPSGDGHLTVRDVERGLETDFWQAKYDATTQHISSTSAAVSFALGAVSAGSGWTGNAANTPLRRGLVTAEDMKAAIDASTGLPYTLQFGLPNVAQGAARWPAVHNVPSGDSSAVVEGTWIRLDPAFDVESSTLPAWQKVIARTLQTRGAINRDTSGTFSFYARNPLNGEAPWSLAGLSGTSAGFSAAFPWNRLQVLAPPG